MIKLFPIQHQARGRPTDFDRQRNRQAVYVPERLKDHVLFSVFSKRSVKTVSSLLA